MTAGDSQFIINALQNSMLQVKLAELTLTHSGSADVKRVGRQIIKDHGKINAELKALAVKKNVSHSEILNSDLQKRYDDVAKLKGSSFDHAYSVMALNDHKAIVATYKEENLSGSDTDVKNWVSVTLPILQHDLMIATDADTVINKK